MKVVFPLPDKPDIKSLSLLTIVWLKFLNSGKQVAAKEYLPEDIESRSMGAGGEDLIMARAARQKFPYSIECKNVQKLNVWEAYEQAKANCGDYEPIVIMKKNNKKPLVVIDAEFFIQNCQTDQP